MTDENDPAKKAVVDMIHEMAKLLNWTPEECRKFACCIHSKTADRVFDDIGEAFQWAQATQTRMAMIDLMKTLPDGVIEAKWDRKTKDLHVRLGEDVVIEHK
jgi:hypothetical protein